MSAIEEPDALAKFDSSVKLVSIALIDDNMVARRLLIINVQERPGTILVQPLPCSNIFQCI